MGSAHGSDQSRGKSFFGRCVQNLSAIVTVTNHIFFLIFKSQFSIKFLKTVGPPNNTSYLSTSALKLVYRGQKCFLEVLHTIVMERSPNKGHLGDSYRVLCREAT